MHFDIYVALAGLIVGVVVGMTGMGGGALMTPILVLVFGVQPLAAVSSDLVASFVMKPIGGERAPAPRTVRWEMVALARHHVGARSPSRACSCCGRSATRTRCRTA